MFLLLDEPMPLRAFQMYQNTPIGNMYDVVLYNFLTNEYWVVEGNLDRFAAILIVDELNEIFEFAYANSEVLNLSQSQSVLYVGNEALVLPAGRLR